MFLSAATCSAVPVAWIAQGKRPSMFFSAAALAASVPAELIAKTSVFFSAATFSAVPVAWIAQGKPPSMFFSAATLAASVPVALIAKTWVFFSAATHGFQLHQGCGCLSCNLRGATESEPAEGAKVEGVKAEDLLALLAEQEQDWDAASVPGDSQLTFCRCGSLGNSCRSC
eukprot:Skav208408  [mRNA]  locus=scaffold1179:384742:386905:+ [translate_table: standard]